MERLVKYQIDMVCTYVDYNIYPIIGRYEYLGNSSLCTRCNTDRRKGILALVDVRSSEFGYAVADDD